MYNQSYRSGESERRLCKRLAKRRQHARKISAADGGVRGAGGDAERPETLRRDTDQGLGRGSPQQERRQHQKLAGPQCGSERRGREENSAAHGNAPPYGVQPDRKSVV